VKRLAFSAKQFGSQPAVIVADQNTLRAAGNAVLDAFRAAEVPMAEPFIFNDADLYAEHRFVERFSGVVETAFGNSGGDWLGTINDLAKLCRASKQAFLFMRGDGWHPWMATRPSAHRLPIKARNKRLTVRHPQPS
jgi:hypothetical protein